jgi:hypothetical protein
LEGTKGCEPRSSCSQKPAQERRQLIRDLEGRLAVHGFRLEAAARGSGVVVADGERRASLSHVDRELSGPKLGQRFGETFREYQARAPQAPEAPVVDLPRMVAARRPEATLAERPRFWSRGSTRLGRPSPPPTWSGRPSMSPTARLWFGRL